MLLFQFLEVGEWVVLGEKIVYKKCLEYDLRLIWRPKKSVSGSPKVRGGGGSRDWDTIPNFSVF